ncbi:MAG: LamG-like jellyroll fold domain-containing protein [Candidatus Saccharibacteria bacterium]|nr:LamG-like jellyroll fold domain-containing protein [Candidatus Saccharibacteria bacterium]
MNISKRHFLFIGITSLVLLGSLLASWLLGYRQFVVISPSMGETAPVGSLVITQPTDTYAPQDIISFYRNGRIYTHRVQEITQDGIITKGDLNQDNDPVPLAQHDVIGKAIFIGRHLGWLWRALPMLLIGWLFVACIAQLKRVRDDWRWPIRIIGGSIVVIIVTFILNPWLHVDLLSYTAHEQGGVNLRVVNTGVFPIRDDKGGRFYAGQTAIIRAVDTDSEGRFVYIPQPSLGVIGVLAAMVWCLTPLLLALLVKLPDSDDDSDHTEHWLLPLIIVTLSCIVLLSQLSSYAAFTASVRNEKSEARSYPLLGCGEGAATMNPRPVFAYGLAEYSGANEPDISGNNRRGTYITAAPFYDLSPRWSGCARHINHAPRFNGSICLVSNHHAAGVPAPSVFSVETWFSTTQKSNGKIIGFGNNGNATSDGQYDRHLYIDKDGRVVFGVYPGTVRTVASPAGVNYADGNWHHVVATLSNNGLKLYVDGSLVASRQDTTGGQQTTGYWKIGCGGGGSWTHGDGTRGFRSQFYTGKLQLPAVYNAELSAQKIRARYQAGV